MTTVIPFSQALRERTWSSHGDSEGAGCMPDLMTGTGTRDDCVALVAQYFFIYEAREAAGERMVTDPVAAPFLSPQLTRRPAIRLDFAFLLGDRWHQLISPLPATERYVVRLNAVAAHWTGGFVAHHYTRYLGDLSGGQVIRTLALPGLVAPRSIPRAPYPGRVWTSRAGMPARLVQTRPDS